MEAEEKSEGGEAEPKQEQEAVQHQQQPEEQSDSHDQKHDLIDLGALVMMCRDLCRRLSPMIKSIYERGELRVIDKAQDADVDITIDAAVKEPSKEPSKEPIAMAAEMTQKMIVGSLQMRFPKLRVYGEEEDLVTGESDIVQQTSVVFEKEIPEQYRQLIASDVVVWVDPINGTKEFTDGVKSAVTTLIGICYRGRPIAGVIARPFSDQVVWGVVGLGAFGFRVDIALQHRDTARRIVCTSRSHFRPSMKAYVSACNPSGFVRAGGCGGKSLMVIEGAADAYVFPSLGTKKWDTAAPEAILLALGGRLTKPDGSLYDYEPRNCTAMNNEGFVATLFDKGYHESYLAHNLNMEQLDLVLFGATGFTGKLAAKFLANEYCGGGGNNNNNGVQSHYRFGLAGRSLAKLQKLLKEELIPIDEHAAKHFELIVCESFNAASVEAMVRKTSCVVTTVGPYAVYGESVIAACCKYGVDYVDITGEYYWVREMIDKYGAEAKRSSARIVNFGGFVSALSDCCIYRGVQYLVDEKNYNESEDGVLNIQHAYAPPASGASQSGGTTESTFAAMKNPSAQKYPFTNAYCLKPAACANGPTQPSPGIWPKYNPTYKCYEAPLLFYSLIDRIVFIRSNMLMNHSYGKNATFHPSILYLKSFVAALFLGLFVFAIPVLLKFAIFRALFLQLRRFMPKPGEGPSMQQMLVSHSKQYIHVSAQNKPKTKAVTIAVEVYGDYGYLNTAKLLVEQGMLFSEQRSNPKLRKIKGGFLTPAAAFGEDLIPRLNRLRSFDISFKQFGGEFSKL